MWTPGAPEPPDDSPEDPNPGPGPRLPPDEDPPHPIEPDLPPERVLHVPVYKS